MDMDMDTIMTINGLQDNTFYFYECFFFCIILIVCYLLWKKCTLN